MIVVLVGGAAWPPALLLVPALAIPTAGLHRMAALIARGAPASFSDFVSGCRHFAVPAFGLGLAASICGVILVVNLWMGLQSDGPIGWFVAASAFYGLVGLAMYLVAAWPILVDPQREQLQVRRRLLLAGLVLVGKPVRLFTLTVAVLLVLAASTVLAAVVAMVGIAYVSLVACRIILPTVDALEARLPEANHAR